VTSGDDVRDVAQFLPSGASHYDARDVLAVLLAGVPAAAGAPAG
jgi:hypothetical protein